MSRFTLELELERRSETVEVVGRTSIDVAETPNPARSCPPSCWSWPRLRGTTQALLPVLPGVVRAADGRIIMKGARSSQSSLQVGGAVVTDPVTGDWGFALPPEAVVAVEVVPNPYTAEYGRFASGVATIETRTGTNKWRFAVNGLIPVPAFRGLRMKGIGSFGPRVSISGAPIKDRFFLHQSARFQILKTRVQSERPPLDFTQLREFETFTRADFNVTSAHTLTSTLTTVAPWQMRRATMNVLTPGEATASLEQRGYTVAVSERGTLSANAVFEASYVVNHHTMEVTGEGGRDLEFTVDGLRGSFFNEQVRHTLTSQASIALTLAPSWDSGQHLVKLGADVLHSQFDGRSASRPVLIRHADGTLGQMIRFSGPSAQRVAGADLAPVRAGPLARERPSAARPGHPGGPRRRAGPMERCAAARRGGRRAARRTRCAEGRRRNLLQPHAAERRAFESYETPVVTMYDEAGAGAAVPYVYRTAAELQTPRSLMWNVEYDQLLGSSVSLRVNHLRRNGSHEFLLEPVRSTLGPELVLDSRGRSRMGDRGHDQLAPAGRRGTERELCPLACRGRSECL